MKETTIEACARAAHEANRAYCLALGDTSQLSWDDAGAWRWVMKVVSGWHEHCPAKAWRVVRVNDEPVVGPFTIKRWPGDESGDPHPGAPPLAGIAAAGLRG